MPDHHAPIVPPLVLQIQNVQRSIAESTLLLNELAGGLLTESLLEHETRRANAASQRASADTLRNKAAKLPPGEHREELVARAGRFVKRAAVLEAGEIMPRELRYPLDSLRLVAVARDAIATAIQALDQVDAEEVTLFVQALQPPTSGDADLGPTAIHTETPSMRCRNELGSHLEMLGAYLDDRGSLCLRTFALAIAAPVVAHPAAPSNGNGSPSASST
jgi:hypothetical protein